MFSTPARRLYGALVAALVFSAASAAAQSSRSEATPQAETTLGEKYHVEFSGGYWHPSASMSVESEYLGIIGSSIDFKNDLGLTDHWFNELSVVGRPARKHKLRFQYIPITYDQSATLTRDIVFRAQRYTVGLPVNSQIEWDTYRFSYEYDFITYSKGFGGFIVDAKYTDVKAGLQSPLVNEFIHARAPIPAIGGVGRYYFMPEVSVTGEVTFFTLPQGLIKQYTAHYADVDIYGTMNFNRYIGAQLGYRALNLGYLVDNDTGSFLLKGFYFGIVARY